MHDLQLLSLYVWGAAALVMVATVASVKAAPYARIAFDAYAAARTQAATSRALVFANKGLK